LIIFKFRTKYHYASPLATHLKECINPRKIEIGPINQKASIQRPKVTTCTKKQKIIKGIISDGSETIKMPDKSSRVQNITLNLLIFDFIFGYSEIKIYF